jgi:hypothetical protein
MLAAQEDIANLIADLAKRKDMTVYQTVNDILEQALRVEGMGLSLREVVDERWMLERAREIGFTFTVEQLLYRVVDEAYEENRERTAKMWREMGHWYGKYFQAKHENPLEAFREAMELFCLGSAEYSLEQNSRDITLNFIGEKLTPGYTELFSLMVEEILLVLGYKVKDRELRKGMVRLHLVR